MNFTPEGSSSRKQSRQAKSALVRRLEVRDLPFRDLPRAVPQLYVLTIHEQFAALFGCFVIVAFNVHAMNDTAVQADHVSSIGVHKCALLTSAIAARPLC